MQTVHSFTATLQFDLLQCNHTAREIEFYLWSICVWSLAPWIQSQTFTVLSGQCQQKSCTCQILLTTKVVGERDIYADTSISKVRLIQLYRRQYNIFGVWCAVMAAHSHNVVIFRSWKLQISEANPLNGKAFWLSHQCTMSCLYSMLSFQPNKVRHILKFMVLIYLSTYICPTLFGWMGTMVFEETIILKL